MNEQANGLPGLALPASLLTNSGTWGE